MPLPDPSADSAALPTALPSNKPLLAPTGPEAGGGFFFLSESVSRFCMVMTFLELKTAKHMQ
jgi:hypothetical protein